MRLRRIISLISRYSFSGTLPNNYNENELEMSAYVLYYSIGQFSIDHHVIPHHTAPRHTFTMCIQFDERAPIQWTDLKYDPKVFLCIREITDEGSTQIYCHNQKCLAKLQVREQLEEKRMFNFWFCPPKKLICVANTQ